MDQQDPYKTRDQINELLPKYLDISKLKDAGQVFDKKELTDIQSQITKLYTTLLEIGNLPKNLFDKNTETFLDHNFYSDSIDIEIFTKEDIAK